MNILIISDYAAPYGGNFICSIRRLCEKMENEGGRIAFVFPTKCEPLEWGKLLSKDYRVSFGIGIKLYKKSLMLLTLMLFIRIFVCRRHKCLLSWQQG